MSTSDNDAVKKLLRSVLLTYKNGVPMHSIQKIYLDVTGERLLDVKSGLSGYDLETFLRNIPEVVRVTNSDGRIMCFGVADDSTRHIAKLVGKQRPAKKERRQNKMPGRRGDVHNAVYWSPKLQLKSKRVNHRLDSKNIDQENSSVGRCLHSSNSSKVLRERNACVNQRYSDNFKFDNCIDSFNNRNITMYSNTVKSVKNEPIGVNTNSPLWRLLNLDTDVQTSIPKSKALTSDLQFNANKKNSLPDYHNNCQSVSLCSPSADFQDTSHARHERSAATKFVRSASSRNAPVRDGILTKQNNIRSCMQTSQKRQGDNSKRQSLSITVSNEHSNLKIPKLFHESHVVHIGVQNNRYQKCGDRQIEDLCVTIKQVCIDDNESWRKSPETDRSVSVIRPEQR